MTVTPPASGTVPDTWEADARAAEQSPPDDGRRSSRSTQAPRAARTPRTALAARLAAGLAERVRRLPGLAWARWARLDTPGYAVLAVALGAFAGSLVLHGVLFPQGSGDADEAAYVMQARMLLDGRLTLDARQVEPFFQPWLTGVHGNHVFTKYLPGWPALLALSQALFGTMAVAPAAVAACWVIGAYLLARELFDDGWTALVAAGFLALSPLFLLHTVLPLAYACCAAVLTFATALLLRGARTGARGALTGGGALVGFGLLIRPFDTVLVALPLAAFVAVRQRRTPRRLLTQVGWTALGAAPLVAVLLAYCWYVTGSPLRLPLSASDPLDTFGFGPRRIMPTEPSFPFTRRMALQALIDTVQAGPSWYFGGLGLISLAAVGLVARRRRAERLLLLATTVTVLVGYTFWWGSAFVMPGLRNGLGPHYHLAGFTPVVILAASGARSLWTLLPTSRPRDGRPPRGSQPPRNGLPTPNAPRVARLVRPTALVLTAAGFATLTVPTLGPRIDGQRYVKSVNSALDALIPKDLPGPALVVVTPGQPSRYTQIPYQTLRNPPGLDGPIVYAADVGPETAALPDRMPDRTIYRLRPDEIADPAVWGSPRGSFVPLRQTTGTRIEVRVTVRPPGLAASAGTTAGSAGASSTGTGSTGTGTGSAGVGGPSAGGSNRPQIYIRLGSDVRSLDLSALRTETATGTAAIAVTHTFVLTTGSATGLDEIAVGGQSLPAELVVGFTAGAGTGVPGWEERISLVQRPAGDLSLLTPGLGWRRLPSIPPGVESAWVAAPVRPTLDVAVSSRQASR